MIRALLVSLLAVGCTSSPDSGPSNGSGSNESGAPYNVVLHITSPESFNGGNFIFDGTTTEAFNPFHTVTSFEYNSFFDTDVGAKSIEIQAGMDGAVTLEATIIGKTYVGLGEAGSQIEASVTLHHVGS
ncbi:MAG: hypothetical protein QM831_44775 [Kofleriaceae bacterium]